MGPNTPSSDAGLHPLMNSRHLALELAPAQWSLLLRDASSQSLTLASGRLEERQQRTLRVERLGVRLALTLDGRQLWAGKSPDSASLARTGVLGLRLDPYSHVVVGRFQIQGAPKPARMSFLWTEALLGAGESPADWTEARDARFRYGLGAVSKADAARAKWNIVGSGLTLWSPRGPTYGTVEVRVDGRTVATLGLHADAPIRSEPVWSVADLPDTFHALVLTAKSGCLPLDCLEVAGGSQ
jgi:hypothetical protein